MLWLRCSVTIINDGFRLRLFIAAVCYGYLLPSMCWLWRPFVCFRLFMNWLLSLQLQNPLSVPVRYWNRTGSTEFHLKSTGSLISSAEQLLRVFWASGGIPVATDFHRKHTISHQNPSGGVMFSTGRESLGEISPEGLLFTQNSTGSVFALPVSLLAGTLIWEGVFNWQRFNWNAQYYVFGETLTSHQ